MSIIKTYRDAFHGLNRETWLLSLVIFINRCGTMAIPLRAVLVHRKDRRPVLPSPTPAGPAKSR